MAIFAVYSDTAEVMSRKHIFTMAWTVDPASDGALYSVHLTIVICNILGEASFIERYLGASGSKVSMTDRDDPVGHGDAVLHSDIMKWLIPR